ncbi:DUF4198 domain-containing protein [Hydrogenophaga sp. XSHU_21]
MKTLLLWAFCWMATSVSAHEFWIAPDRFTARVNEPIALSVRVGEGFLGEPAAFGQPMAVSLRWHHRAGKKDLTTRLPPTLGQDRVAMAFDRAGTHVIALDTQPTPSELPADKFTDYLREDGLEHIVALREAKGQSDQVGRERFQRHVKTLLSVGNQHDSAYRVRTGQILEIVPLKNPQLVKPGESLAVEVLFKGAPLAGALVRVWNRSGDDVEVLTDRTDAAGRSVATLSRCGRYMVSVVHMVPAADPQAHDWDSHWGNLTFETSGDPSRCSADPRSIQRSPDQRARRVGNGSEMGQITAVDHQHLSGHVAGRR